jgi:hypothetical protein
MADELNLRQRDSRVWFLGAILLVLVAALALRYTTNVRVKGPTFDERYIHPPITALIDESWSVENAIDFEETKGPALIWTYALVGELVGSELNRLRLVSVAFFVLGSVPLLLIGRACGVAGPWLLIVAALYVLLPHNAVLGQLLMSEPVFVFGSLWLMWIFVRGFGASAASERRVIGPVAFGAILAILLHNRVHAAAFGAAAVLVAWERDGRRSWPWWAACAAAGLVRVPLWIRWGGLVSPEYQSMHGLGFSPASLTYLGAAVGPLTVMFLWPWWTGRCGRPRWLPWSGAALGLLLGVLAAPDLAESLTFGSAEISRYLGFVSSGTRLLTTSATWQMIIVGGLAAVGLASLASLLAIGLERRTWDAEAVVWRLAAWMLVCGWAMYALTRAFVFDRYLLPWAILLPVVWVRALPRALLALQAAGLALILGWLTWNWLIKLPPG